MSSDRWTPDAFMGLYNAQLSDVSAVMCLEPVASKTTFVSVCLHPAAPKTVSATELWSALVATREEHLSD